MTDTVRVLREKSDDTNVRLSSMTQELESIRQTIASMPPAVGWRRAGQPIRPPIRRAAGAPHRAAGGPRRPTLPPPNVSPQRTYDTAYSDYTAGQYDLAIDGFQDVPEVLSRVTRNADDAQLNIGNALYNAGKTEGSGHRVPAGDLGLPADRQRAGRVLQARD